MNSHLTPQQMLAYIDGELSRGETRRLQKHLHSCWTCLAEMERLKGDITTILDSQNEAFAPALPRPPQPWPGFDTILARKLPAQPITLRMRFRASLQTLLSPAHILLASGIALALMVGLYSFFHTETVSAKEILKRVQFADAERSQITKDQVIRQRVQIRKIVHSEKSSKQARVDTWKSPMASYWNVTDRDSAATDLQAEYQTHKIPMDLPLSSVAVASWGRAAGGNPTLSRQGADMGLTFAESKGKAERTVERVSLLIQPQNWHIKQMTLDFSDVSFEVTEDDYSVMSTNEVPVDLLAHLEPENRPFPLVRPASKSVSDIADAVRLPVVDLDKAELDVLTTLHGLNADLGEPVTITRSHRAIRVGLWQLPAERQSEISMALLGKPDVQVELAAPRRAKLNSSFAESPSKESGVSLQVAGNPNAEDQSLIKYFGSPQREREFTNEVIGSSTTILSHLYALRNLQIEFPAEKSQLLLLGDEAQLGSLVQDHRAAISENLEYLSKQLAPLNAHFDISSCAVSVAQGATWQGRSLKALEVAREADHLLKALFTTSQTPVAPATALPEIGQRICQLRTEMEGLKAQDIH